LALFPSAEAIRPDSARHSPKDHTEVRQANDDCKTTAHETEIIMTTTIKTTHRSLVALSLPKSVPALIVYAQGIVKRMTGNPSFPDSAPELAAVSTAIAELQTAEAAALARTKGAASTRNEKRKTLVALLQALRGHIQSTADAQEANSQAIIESAGVALRKTPTRRARVFAAKPGRVSGVATVVAASAGHRASYEWDRGWIPRPIGC
jgi:hypothetical protein